MHLLFEACGGGLVLEGVAASGSGGRSADASTEAANILNAAMDAALRARYFSGLGCGGRSVVAVSDAFCVLGEAVRLSFEAVGVFFEAVAVQHAILPRSCCHPSLQPAPAPVLVVRRGLMVQAHSVL